MDNRRKDRLEAAANSLLRKHGKHIPVNLEAIAQSLRMDLVLRPALAYQGQPVSGLLIQKDGRKICAINSDDALTRRRFTLAHEIGHLVLHPATPEHFDMKARSAGSIGNPREEAEANQFAAFLLMPEAAIRNRVPVAFDPFWDDWEPAVADLAAAFEVSREAMSIRLGGLGLL